MIPDSKTLALPLSAARMQLVCFAMAAGLVACNSPDSAGAGGPDTGGADLEQARVFTQSDDGRAVEIPARSQFEVRLPTTPGTGYGWAVHENAPARLETVRDEVLPADPAMPGSEQVHVFAFRTLEPGPAALRLVYRRPWESEAEPMRTFALQIEITDRP